jgi:hypothetical protein
MSFFKKLKKVVAKFDFGHQMVKKMGLPDPSGDALYGSDAAQSPAEMQAEQAKLARDQAAQLQAQQQVIQSNFATDLKGENLNSVIAGGTADMSASAIDPTKRKKASGLSATLGMS